MRDYLLFMLDWFKPHARLTVENLCLRQQLAVLATNPKRPKLKNKDRRFWILVSRWLPGWRDCLVVVKSETVLKWHRKGWRHYWRWKSRNKKSGRRKIAVKLRQLIRRMKQENPLWGQVRIYAELLGLGMIVSPRTVAKYMKISTKKPPSPGWRAFLKIHAHVLWACDFLTVRTLTFRTLYVFFLIHHSSREIVHVRVTKHPTARWTGQQLVNACFDREPPKYLIRDNDAIFGQDFRKKAGSLGIKEVRTPIRSPKANAIAERFVGTLRRECLDHVLIFNERHCQKIVDEYIDYYNHHRPHRSLDHQPPCPMGPHKPTLTTGPPTGEIISLPVLGGLHHIYQRAA